MNMRTGLAQSVLIIGFFILSVGLVTGTAEAKKAKPPKVVTVDCAAGDTIADALTKAKAGKPLIVDIFGVCTENVTITKDDVTLSGGGTGTVDGQITIDGARRVVIDGLTVTGLGSGIEARANAAVTVRNSMIVNNTIHGIDVRQGAFVLIDGNTIRLNGHCEVLVRDSGNVRMLNNTVESDQPKPSSCNALVGAFRDARIRMRGGNSITGGPGPAVDIEHGSVWRQDGGHDTVVGRVTVFNLSHADLRDIDLTGDVNLGLNANLRMRDSVLTGNVDIGGRSLAQFRSSVTVSGTVTCFGSGTVGLGSTVPLTLVDSQGGDVRTSANGVAWVFRGAVFGPSPTFVGTGGFNGCN